MSSITDKAKRQKRREQSRQKKKRRPVRRSIVKPEHRQLARPYFAFKPRKFKKILGGFLIGLAPLIAGASPIIIPTGDSNHLYYQIGGGSDYRFSSVPYSTPINLAARVDLGLGNQCGMYNPALSISNTLNDLADSVNNLTQNLIANATGSIAEMPMYFLALANPTLYNLLNNSLINAHTIIDASVKSCEQTRDQIAQGKNPYQDWATLSIGDSWKQHLSLTAAGAQDINDANITITHEGGNDGVAWVQGKTASDGSLHAAGKGQPPVHAVADTVKAGYNALLNRDFSSDLAAPMDSELASEFATPQAAVDWIVAVVGDQTITTCTDSSCKSAQGTVAGRGLLPLMTVCTDQNKNDCVDNLNNRIWDLVNGAVPMTKENLLVVSADDLVMSPQAIRSLQNIDPSQQGIYIHKLAQEVAMQRVMGKALTARDILQVGRQIPVIASNHPAQTILQDKRIFLDDEIHNLSFEAQVRKQMMSDTLSGLMNFSTAQQNQAFGVGKINNAQPLMQNSAIPDSTSGGR